MVLGVEEMREKLEETRNGVTHKAMISGVNVYIRTGEYPDGRLGEVFISVDKHGSEMRLLDAAAICISVGLQHGVKLRAFTDKLRGQRLGTGGVCDDPEQPLVPSILSYFATWLERTYPDA
jgi:ribonucleoside-diphosphate reductase alpha chain